MEKKRGIRRYNGGFCRRGHGIELKNKRGACTACVKEQRQHSRYYWRNLAIKNHDGTQFDVSDFNRAFQEQAGMCLGCGVHQSRMAKALFVDHDHATGFFRGLLCHHCNFSIGNAKDSPKTLRILAAYLERHLEKLVTVNGTELSRGV